MEFNKDRKGCNVRIIDWLPDTITLNGEIVTLMPLEEKHFTELEVLAADGKIWEFIPVDMSTAELRRFVFSVALMERERGTQMPFVITSKTDGKIIGSTRLLNIDPAHKKLEIGWTWLHPDYWATAANLECKLLLLTFCFDTLGAVRVQLRTDERNIRSRKAIAKIGGQYEGILRHDLIRDNGTFRNSAYFSLIHTEWNDAKTNLTTLLLNKTGLFK